MGRQPRVVVPDFPHHVTQRGNRGGDVFRDEVDRRVYLEALTKYCSRYGVETWAYCLMTNHVHLVLVPRDIDALAKVLRDAHTRYAVKFNKRTGLTGHLWHARFYSSVLDDRYLWAATRYVERNPVRAGMVSRAEDHRWSSAAAHCGLRTDNLLTGRSPVEDEVEDWSSWLAEAEDHERVSTIRKNTQFGLPSGSERFVQHVEAKLGRTVRPHRRGRPKR